MAADAVTGAGERNVGRRVVLLLATALVALCMRSVTARAADDEPGRIERIELKTEAAATKVIVMLSRPLAFDVAVLDGEASRQSARRLVLDFDRTTIAPAAAAPVKIDDGFVRQIRTGTPTAGKARIVLDLASGTTHTVEAYETPPHVTIAIRAASGAAPDPAPAVGAPPDDAPAPAEPTAVRKPKPTPKPTPAHTAPKPTKHAKPKPHPTKTPAKKRTH